MSELGQQLLNGLAAGSVYALLAVGYSLVYGLLELINFAHGHVYMVGTFVVLSSMLAGLPFAFAVIIGMGFGALLGVLIERIAYRPFRGANRIIPTVSAVAVTLILENIAARVWGPATRRFDTPLPTSAIAVLGLRISWIQVIVLAVTAVIAVLLYLLVQHTSWGRNVRAIRDDMQSAELVGVPVNRIVTSVYALGGALGVLAGVLFAAYYDSVYVSMGFYGTLYAFTAAVIGGIGDLRGAFVGGILLGIVQALTAGYISSGYMDAITFGLLIVFLVFRPLGLSNSGQVSRV